MVTAFSSVSWEEAARSFFLHKRATRSFRTALYYRGYVGSLTRWANDRGLSLDQFTKRHLDEYLVHRTDQGLSPTSIRHDALVATVFFEWCKKNDLIEHDPLAEYKVRSAPKPYRYMPKEGDMQRLLTAIPQFYDASINADARFSPPARRHAGTSTANAPSQSSWWNSTVLAALGRSSTSRWTTIAHASKDFTSPSQRAGHHVSFLCRKSVFRP